MCRRWGGAPFFGIHCGDVVFDDDKHLKRYDSSDWAQRGFCDVCGSSLFYFAKPHQRYSMSAGIFDDQSQFRMNREIFIDYKPPGYTFAGEQELMTEKEVLERWA